MLLNVHLLACGTQHLYKEATHCQLPTTQEPKGSCYLVCSQYRSTVQKLPYSYPEVSKQVPHPSLLYQSILPH